MAMNAKFLQRRGNGLATVNSVSSRNLTTSMSSKYVLTSLFSPSQYDMYFTKWSIPFLLPLKQKEMIKNSCNQLEITSGFDTYLCRKLERVFPLVLDIPVREYTLLQLGTCDLAYKFHWGSFYKTSPS